METVDLEKLHQLVLDCGQAVLNFQPKNVVVLSSVDDNMKTNLDIYANEMMTRGLRQILDIPVISEEDQDHSDGERPSIYWLIDPLDGTRSYLDGFKTYVTQAALISNSKPTVAAIYVPALGELFTAVKGEGAYKNKRKIQKLNKAVPESVIDNYPKPNTFLQNIMRDLSITKYIECGSIALKICRVSDGTADLFIKNTRVHDWDVAPGELILSESGGKLGLVNGSGFEFRGKYRKESLLVTGSSDSFSKISESISQHLNI